jgi:mannosyltransferase OCH1-like enzyme
MDIETGKHRVTPLVHQTWRNRLLATHSPYAPVSRRSTREYHPGFKHWLWTDADIDEFVTQHVARVLPDLATIYRELPEKIMRIDFVRYLWMYVFGGMYADLDLIVLRSFNELFSADASVYFIERAWTTGDSQFDVSVHQAWLASAPGHPIWLELMRFIGRQLRAGETRVLDLTGPNGVSRAVSELELLKRFPDVRVLPAECLFQEGWSKTPRQLAYCQHLPTATWRQPPARVMLNVTLRHLRQLRRAF